jgi:hypothetical protein
MSCRLPLAGAPSSACGGSCACEAEKAALRVALDEARRQERALCVLLASAERERDALKAILEAGGHT